MKEKFFTWYNTVLSSVLTTLVLAVGLTACSSSDDDDDEIAIWEFYPFCYAITMEDVFGHDLLDSTYTDNLLNRISGVYEGNTYTYTGNPPVTRYLPPEFDGFTLRKKKSGDKEYYVLLFGEFDGGEYYNRNELDLMLDGNLLGHLSFFNNIAWKSKNDPEVQRYFYFNGQDIGRNESGSIYRLLITPQGSAELLQAY